jgi:hypothetical protein
MSWTDANLETQGYGVGGDEARALRIAPPNPIRRRHAFKLATVWLAVVAALFALDAATAALVLGGLLVAVCSLVTATNFCIPSTLLAWLEGPRGSNHITSTWPRR